LLMLLPFKAMLLLERAGGRNLAAHRCSHPSFKVRGILLITKAPASRVAPGLKADNARGPLKVQGASGRTSENEGGPEQRV